MDPVQEIALKSMTKTALKLLAIFTISPKAQPL